MTDQDGIFDLPDGLFQKVSERLTELEVPHAFFEKPGRARRFMEDGWTLIVIDQKLDGGDFIVKHAAMMNPKDHKEIL